MSEEEPTPELPAPQLPTPQLHPRVYKVMLDHWLDNQPANIVAHLDSFWHRGMGVNFIEKVTIKYKQYDIIKRPKKDKTLEEILAEFRRGKQNG